METITPDGPDIFEDEENIPPQAPRKRTTRQTSQRPPILEPSSFTKYTQYPPPQPQNKADSQPFHILPSLAKAVGFCVQPEPQPQPQQPQPQPQQPQQQPQPEQPQNDVASHSPQGNLSSHPIATEADRNLLFRDFRNVISVLNSEANPANIEALLSDPLKFFLNKGHPSNTEESARVVEFVETIVAKATTNKERMEATTRRASGPGSIPPSPRTSSRRAEALAPRNSGVGRREATRGAHRVSTCRRVGCGNCGLQTVMVNGCDLTTILGTMAEALERSKRLD